VHEPALLAAIRADPDDDVSRMIEPLEYTRDQLREKLGKRRELELV